MKNESQAGTPDVDAQLMLRFQAGELGAFDELFSRHVHALVNFAFRFVRNREVAEEMAQEVLLRVHDAAPHYRPKARFTTWLYRIATNVCLNEIRRPHFKAMLKSQDCETALNLRGGSLAGEDRPDARADAALQRRAIGAALRAALEGLPEKQRVAFILNKYQELSYVEVAEVMNLSEKAVKSVIHRAKEALAERLRPLLPGLL
jgi:RNA polymerase sigma-70 factor, ECF subfamily